MSNLREPRAFLDGCKRFFALPAVLAFEVGYSGKTVEQ